MKYGFPTSDGLIATNRFQLRQAFLLFIIFKGFFITHDNQIFASFVFSVFCAGVAYATMSLAFSQMLGIFGVLVGVVMIYAAFVSRTKRVSCASSISPNTSIYLYIFGAFLLLHAAFLFFLWRLLAPRILVLLAIRFDAGGIFCAPIGGLDRENKHCRRLPHFRLSVCFALQTSQ